jgi:heptosyltransferase-2
MDCRHFRGDRPCAAHKQYGCRCEDCREYDPVTARILIVKIAADGDVLRTTCLLPALKDAYPGCHITWVTKPSAKPLLLNNPLIDRVLSPIEQFLPLLTVESFDLVINPDADLQSCSIASLAKGKEKRGFLLDEAGRIEALSVAAQEWLEMGLRDDLKKQNRRSYPEIIYRVAGLHTLLHGPALHLTEEEIADAGEHLARCGWKPGNGVPVIGVNTGAGSRWRRKALPVETIEGLLERLLDGDTAVDIFLLGGPEEKDRNRHLSEKFGGKVVHTGIDNSLRRFAGIISYTDVLVAADTLALHIGIALGKYVVVHMGPTSSPEIDVRGKGEILVPDMDCLCCYLNDCDCHPACNELITPEVLVRSVKRGLTLRSKTTR